MLRRCLVSGVCLFVFLIIASAGAFAQRAGIFVTPVPNAPFRGVVEVQRSIVQKNGTVINLKTMRIIARDSAGRIYTRDTGAGSGFVQHSAAAAARAYL